MESAGENAKEFVEAGGIAHGLQLHQLFGGAVAKDSRPGIAASFFQMHDAFPEFVGLRRGVLLLGDIRAGRVPGIHLRVQGIVQGAIEIVGVRALKHHGEIFAIGPVGLVSELCVHAVEELGSGQRIGNGDADVVRAGVPNELDGVLNVEPGLAGIAELEEVACANAFAAEIFTSLGDLIDAGALVHGVENFLRSGLGAHPDLGAARAAKSGDRVGTHEIDARLHLERNGGVQLLNFVGELAHPPGLQAEDVVGEPEVIGAKVIFELAHFFGDEGCGANRE